jgi:hypothetical protein
MAKSEKNNPPPTTHQVVAPEALAPIMQAFHVDSEEAAHSLILEASKAIYGSKKPDYDFIGPKDREISKEELDGISSLMRGISPKDSLETLYAAQIVASHMLGMRKLSSSYNEDQKLGLKLLQFCNDSMQQLEKKRSGGGQNITVNHNYNGQGNTLTQTIIPTKER